MERIRLTERFARNLLKASNYGNLRVNLLKLYSGLSDCAKRFGLEGDLRGSGFVLHHLDISSAHFIPSCIKYKKLAESVEKEDSSKELNRLLRLKSYIQDFGLRVTKKEVEEFKNMPDEEFWGLYGKIKELDDEVAKMAVIPEDFHNFLHSKSRKGEIKLPTSEDECHELFDIYLEEMSTDEQIAEYEEKTKSFRGNLENIVEISRLLKTKRHTDIFKCLETCSRKLIKILKQENKKS